MCGYHVSLWIRFIYLESLCLWNEKDWENLQKFELKS